MVSGGKGEVMFDNRNSSQGVQEFETITCAHCNVVRYILNNQILRIRLITQMPENVVVDFEWREIGERSRCFKCNAWLCENPICHKDCLPVKAGVILSIEKGIDLPVFNTDERSRYVLHESYETTRVYTGLSLGSVSEDKNGRNG